jgi:hypothetical protein
MNLDEATTRYDTAFRSVQGLTWLPWVGQRYFERPPQQRLLVVGESQYYKTQAEREERSRDPKYTRDIVSESLIHGEWTTPTLTNIPKLLFKTSDIDGFKLWGDSAYYNFIQRLMDYKQDGQPERPNGDDFAAGWRVFAEVVRVIQPSHCLFIGVQAANSYNLGSVSCTQQVGRTWARVAKLEAAGKTTELIFVQHLGKYFSWSEWHDYLQARHTDFMSWIGAESYANSRNA